VVKRIAFAVPGDLATLTGGYAYDRRMISELHNLGWQIDVIDLGEGFPWPSQDTRETAQTRLLEIPARCTAVIDGLALGVMPEAASKLSLHHPLLALVHHPLALEAGLSVERADSLHDSERAALALAQGVVVTSTATARILTADYGVAAKRITVANPGTDRSPMAQGSKDGIVRLLSIGAVVPRKGFNVLIAALATLPDLPWQLAIAGDRTRDPVAVKQLDADIARYRLGDRVAVLGAVSPQRLEALYAESDAFVLASHFEGYGMAYAEAIAHGLPVIGTTGGAIPDTVPPEAGLLVPPGDISAFAQALSRVIGDGALRRELARGAQAAAPRLPTWRQSAELFAGALEALA
jgi:glycosyltransferase involved in cell wall biosynthesis